MSRIDADDRKINTSGLVSRRKYIPKADGRQRPLGIAALEDKIVQAAAVAVLTPIYESEFLGFSYGFRPKRSQHQALDALAFGIGRRRINWVLYCDVQSFFDKVGQDWLIRFVERRIGDRRIIRLIAKWLMAGVLEDIEPGSPWENGYCESFKGKLRDELLNGEIFYTLKEAQIMIEIWRQHYNRASEHPSVYVIEEKRHC
jgi:Integrase core domain/Reverse transcriptase (RNA-dependent DNA polymerase)